MIDRALFKLFALLARSWARRMLRGTRHQTDQLPIADMAEPYFPILLMGLCLTFAFTTAGERAVYFSPAEVNFLFAGPFSRRELLLYKLGRTLLGVLVLSLFMATTQWLIFRSWIAAYVGIALSLIFLQLVAMTTAMVGQIVAESAYTQARKTVLAVVLVAVAVGMSQAFAWSGAGNLTQMARHFAGTAPGLVVLAPFQVFGHAAFSRQVFPDLLLWGSGGLLIDAAVLVLILKLDADYMEMAATVSQKMYAQIQRMRQGGGFSAGAGSGAWRFRIPALPWLGGAGPVAWRQLLLAIRTSRQMIVMSLSLCAMLLLGIVFSKPGGMGPQLPVTAGIAMVSYLTFLFSMQAPWGFRGDIDRMDWLKMLPAGALAVATGELIGGVLILTAIQLIVFAGTAAIAPSAMTLALVAAVFSLPVNIVLMASNNFLFLLYPVRAAMGTSFDLQLFGRMMLALVLQSVLLLPAFGFPALFGAVAYLAFDWSIPAFGITAWLVLVAELPVLLMGLAWAFERFDPSLHTPAED
jgi:hypothetical protein